MFDRIQHIHIVGIGGIGISALAKFLLAQGKTLTASDAHLTEITHGFADYGIKVVEGHHEQNVPELTELLIYSPAVPETNPERQRAVQQGIPQCSYAQALGELSKLYSTIVVTGTHGKSTTTAMLGLILEEAGYDPTVILGSFVPRFKQGNIRIGSGRFLVVEGCEHQANMLNLHPEMIVLTNIEADHLDYYGSLENIKNTFQTFVNKLSGTGLVVINADDPISRTLAIPTAVSYGEDTSAQYNVHQRKVGHDKQSAQVKRLVPNEPLGTLILTVPGKHNLSNAMAATAAAMEFGIPFETCARVLKKFSGIWRRFEKLGCWRGVEIISDYGHHPTAIRRTLEAARELYTDKQIILCFQPHQHSRTRALFDEFVEALAEAHAVILPEIYRVEGRTEREDISSENLLRAINQKHPDVKVQHVKDFASAKQALERCIATSPDAVIIIQGAGSIDELARSLI